MEINSEEIKINLYHKYLEYRTKWRLENKDKVNEYAKKQYQKKFEEDPTFRSKLNEKEKLRQAKQKIINGVDVMKRGRPRTRPENEKKAIGRPRKYV